MTLFRHVRLTLSLLLAVALIGTSLFAGGLAAAGDRPSPGLAFPVADGDREGIEGLPDDPLEATGLSAVPSAAGADPRRGAISGHGWIGGFRYFLLAPFERGPPPA